jgi:hypothetical protein
MRLYMLIVSRLQSDTALLDKYRSRYASADLPAEEVGAKVLERVKIMRVFDLVGVREAVGEIREGLEAEGKVGAGEDNVGSREMVDVEEGKAEEAEKVKEAVPMKKTEIADSEDEEEEDDEDEDEDEMLLNTESASFARSIAPPIAPILNPDLARIPVEERTAGDGRMAFIFIDNLAHVINPLLKKDYIQSKPQTTSSCSTRI